MVENTTTESPATPPSPDAPRTPRPTRRSLFWPGFAAAFLLLSLLSCGGLAMSFGLNRLDLAALQDSGPVWTPPPATPTIEPVAVPAGEERIVEATGGAFQVGEQARNVTGDRVNIRRTPGHLGKVAAQDIVAQVAPGDSVQIVGGRALQDNLIWWLVSYNGVEGWMAEATASGVQILGR